MNMVLEKYNYETIKTKIIISFIFLPDIYVVNWCFPSNISCPSNPLVFTSPSGLLLYPIPVGFSYHYLTFLTKINIKNNVCKRNQSSIFELDRFKENKLENYIFIDRQSKVIPVIISYGFGWYEIF